MRQFNTYADEDGNDCVFTIFIIHGHTPELSKVDKFIRKELNFDTMILQKDYKPGEIIDSKLKDRLKQVDCAVVIMSPDDHTTSGMFRPRRLSRGGSIGSRESADTGNLRGPHG